MGGGEGRSCSVSGATHCGSTYMLFSPQALDLKANMPGYTTGTGSDATQSGDTNETRQMFIRSSQRWPTRPGHQLELKLDQYV